LYASELYGSIADGMIAGRKLPNSRIRNYYGHVYIVLSTERRRVRGTLQFPRLRLIWTVFSESCREFTHQLNFS